MSRSLFNRLLITLLGSLMALWLVTIVIAAWRAHREAGALHDRQLEQTAQVLLALAGQEIVEHLEAGDATPAAAPGGPGDALGLADLAGHLARYAPPGGLAFHIHASGGSFQFRSANFPAGLDDEGAQAGFRDLVLAGEPWRVFTRRDDARIVAVQVAQRAGERRRIGQAILAAILPPLVAGMPLAIALTLLHVRRARRPLADLAAALAGRGPGRLEPVRIERPAREIAPIVDALNRLVEHLRERMASERRFTGDAAHELRTPLAALQADTEIALESGGERREAALARLRAGTERSARLVGQMLTLARLDPIAGIEDRSAVDLGACAQEILARSAPEAARRGTGVALEERSPALALGHPALVEVLVSNLVENAIRHTPEGGRVEVVTEGEGSTTRLRVADSGPGIAPEERDRVLERFYRSPGATSPGSGLGLSIVARICALHRARLSLGEAALGGLEVTVEFPAPRPPARGLGSPR